MKKITLFISCLVLPCMLFAQSLRVVGTVLDEQTSEPLIGVSVLEEGTSNGIITDIDGNFVLDVQQGAKLQLSYVGYASRTIAAKANMGNVSMEPEVVALQDVTIVGQIARQQKTPVAVSQVAALEIEERLGGQEFPEVLK